MMTCKEIAELLMDYCDGELSEEHCAVIRQHLFLCGPCHNFMVSYQVTIRMGRSLPCGSIPQHLIDKVRAALNENR